MSSAGPGAAQSRGRYAIYSRIAAGGMASVHFGLLRGPAGFSRVVAIKKLHPQFVHDPDFVAMLLDEARIASRVRHPNVVSTLDVVQEGDELLLVLEYIAGESLSRLLALAAKRGEVTPPAIAVAIASGMLHGLHAAHEARDDRGEPLDLVHRDVSPQNVLVGSDGTPRVVDFGIARATGRSQTTREGQLKGKIPYMAPEQLRSGEVSRQSDVWSASVVIWEMLTGKRLFDGDSEGHVYSRILHERAPKPSSVVASIAPELDAVVLRGLARATDRRFATTRELALALEACVAPATAAQVAAWVEALAHDALADRAATLLSIERREATEAIEPAAPPAAPVTGLAEATVVATTLEAAPRAPRRRASILVGASIALVGAVAGLLAWRAPVAPAIEVAAAPAASLFVEVASSAPAASAPAASSATLLPAPSAAPIAAVATPSSRPTAASSTRPARRPAPAAAAPHARGDHCYTRDDAGIWHIKPECL